jgi:prevent-host-death family protein
MKFVNVRELKNKTSSVLRYTEKGDDVIVTSRGKPCAVIHHLSEDDIEDYILLSHPDFKKKLEEAYQQYLAGETIDIDTLIKKAERGLGRI